MFDFSMNEFKLASEATLLAQREARRQQQEEAPSFRAYFNERTASGYQGLTADGKRVSDAVDYLGFNWVGQWATVERTESGYVIVGGAAHTGDPPDPDVDGDGG